MTKKFIYLKLILTFYLIISSGCAYFNYFHNANEFYDQAQSQILDLKDGEELSSSIIDLFNKTIERCNIVIENYPESKFVPSALFLKSKAHFYKNEYVLSKSTLEKLSSFNLNNLQIIESELWKLKSDWYILNDKKIIKDIKEIIYNSKSLKKNEEQSILLTAYLSLAEIYQETNIIDSSLYYLNQRALIAKDRSSRMKASYLIAEKAYNEKKYDIALENFKKTANFHPSIKINQYSNIMVIRILRELKKWDEAALIIESLVNNEKFESINAELLLELANLLLTQNKLNESIDVFRQITEKYPKTIFSAEAYFNIGNYSLDIEKNYSKAKKMYENVELEFPSSIYISTSKSRINEINLVESYNDSINIYKAFIKTDSTNVKNLTNETIHNKISFFYYSIAEIEAFRFNHINDGINYFNIIVNDYPNSSFSPKSLFSLYHLYQKISNNKLRIDIRDKLLKDYSDTDYSRFISNSIGLEIQDLAGERMLNAEIFINQNPAEAINLYKKILEDFPKTSYYSSIILSIAYIYDFNLNDFHSAYSYYKQLKENHPLSDQAIFASKRLVVMDKASTILPDSISIKND